MRSTRSPSARRYPIPANLMQPLWLRSRESLVDNGLVYDPIAATACQRCLLAPECLSGDIDQKQLLHVTLTQLCDQQVRSFLEAHPDGWIINVGAGWIRVFIASTTAAVTGWNWILRKTCCGVRSCFTAVSVTSTAVVA